MHVGGGNGKSLFFFPDGKDTCVIYQNQVKKYLQISINNVYIIIPKDLRAAVNFL